ncbi:hypothetical protein [Longimycelium tulufanense]|uniref:hypothetical protein n=1 Tax=Longimycelium tulufanense TaxID=907463 RepID=UPI0016699D09|nr:hypothetical protein [Longimycelium tulufanense]
MRVGVPPQHAIPCLELERSVDRVRELIDAEFTASRHRVRAAAVRTTLSVHALRICRVTVVPWALHGVLAAPAGCAVTVDGHGGELCVDPDMIIPVNRNDFGAARMVRRVLEGHLGAVAERMSGEPGTARRAMEGQIGFGVGSAMARASRAGAPFGPLLAGYRRLVEHAPWLGATGSLHVVEGRLEFRRTCCCLWWTAPDEEECTTCPRRRR